MSWKNVQNFYSNLFGILLTILYNSDVTFKLNGYGYSY